MRARDAGKRGIPRGWDPVTEPFSQQLPDSPRHGALDHLL
jgi:hypothetical protein